jgi:hypothetical protein
MFCSKCGAQMKEDTKFCAECGQNKERALPNPVKSPGKKLMFAGGILFIVAGIAGWLFVIPSINDVLSGSNTLEWRVLHSQVGVLESLVSIEQIKILAFFVVGGLAIAFNDSLKYAKLLLVLIYIIPLLFVMGFIMVSRINCPSTFMFFFITAGLVGSLGFILIHIGAFKNKKEATKTAMPLS